MTKFSFLALVTTLSLATAAHAAIPSITTIGAITAVQQQSGGVVVEIDLRDHNGQPAYHVQALTNGSRFDFLVDGLTGKVNSMAGDIAAVTTDAIESGEGPNDADSVSEDAN